VTGRHPFLWGSHPTPTLRAYLDMLAQRRAEMKLQTALALANYPGGSEGVLGYYIVVALPRGG